MPDEPDIPTLSLLKPERSGNTLVSASQSYSECRKQLLVLLGYAFDLLPQVAPLSAERPGRLFRAVFPPEILSALERGELHLVEAKDGTGFLPFVFDDNGIKKQLRIVPERLHALDANALANAAANATTHALLQQVLVKLDAIEKKVDRVLANQRAEWRGRVAAGVQQLKAIEQDPGDPLMRPSILANGLQSLEEGRHTGLLQLQAYMESQARPPSTWWRQVWAGIRFQVPSEQQAVILDRAQEDLEWLYVASVSSAKIHQMSGRETLAREALPQFAVAVASVLDDCQNRFPLSRYSPVRAQFWEERVSALRALPEPRTSAVAIEFDQQEIQELTSNHEPE